MDMITPDPAINRIELVVMIGDRHGIWGTLRDDHALYAISPAYSPEGLSAQLHSFQSLAANVAGISSKGRQMLKD